MIRRALIAALFAATFTAPVHAHDDTTRPLIRHAGTPDVAIRVDAEHYVQVAYLDDFALDRIGLRDCVYFEDGSARCN